MKKFLVMLMGVVFSTSSALARSAPVVPPVPSIFLQTCMIEVVPGKWINAFTITTVTEEERTIDVSGGIFKKVVPAKRYNFTVTAGDQYIYKESPVPLAKKVLAQIEACNKK